MCSSRTGIAGRHRRTGQVAVVLFGLLAVASCRSEPPIPAPTAAMVTVTSPTTPARTGAQLGDTAIPVALPDGIKDPSQLATQPDGREQFAAALLHSVGHTPAEGQTVS